MSPILCTRAPAFALVVPALAMVVGCGETPPPLPGDLPGAAQAALLEPTAVPPDLLPLEGRVERVVVGLRGQEVFASVVAEDGQGFRLTRHRWDGRAGAWTTGEPLPFASPGEGDRDLTLSPDGSYLLFASRRPADHAGASDSNLWVSQREVGPGGETVGWSRPWLVPGVHSQAWDGNPSMAGDGSLWFASAREGPATGTNLFLAPFEEGGWSAPVPLPEPINSVHDEGDPFIAPDRSFLLFASNREGRWDLYVSYREGEAWGEVQRLGGEVNTRGDERAPWLSSAGRTLFFTRDGELRALPASRAGVVRPPQEDGDTS
jgi:hypothetical protein